MSDDNGRRTELTKTSTHAVHAEASQRKSSSINKRLTVIAIVSTLFYATISWLSWRFDFASTETTRPIVPVLLFFTATFIAYLIATAIVLRANSLRGNLTPNPSGNLKVIIGAAIVFRIILLFSLPIQEVDLYRYLWDGAVSNERVSPFTYSPEQVRQATILATDDGIVNDDRKLVRLVDLTQRAPSLAEILNRVHYPELPTIYPLTSQAVFSVVDAITPASTSLKSRVFILKATLIGFDLATLFVVIALLRICQQPASLCILYAWCPLLMKEVANSGHLDAIAVFLTAIAVYLLVRGLTNTRSISSRLERIGAAFMLSLAVGAKLYPIVLVPIFTVSVAKRFGVRAIILPGVLFAVTTALLLWPMNPTTDSVGDPSRGVVTFLQQWEMNDFLFALINENLKPNNDRSPNEIAWFTVVPDPIRTGIVRSFASRLSLSPHRTPFILTRILTGVIFSVVAFVIAWRATLHTSSSDDSIPQASLHRIGEAVFLTLAWFWLLCPTQNPWYWTWVLPFLPFARSRVWLLMSGLVFLYYLRFWFGYHFPTTQVAGSMYRGTTFFDFVITWLEFAPWFACLAAVSFCRRRHGRCNTDLIPTDTVSPKRSGDA
ncbi:hypothetical protein [Rhodopirellula sp. SWK7]|uniref:hypothetical protein n=1 Tax=Rhodopirellula sp. SWK7 TaxID=595460 RepID=UPI0002BEB5F4|nr:hypothetical protein [Rhodopirellula sp. SWK7]EMI45640.1 putative membrane protein [Rhodopirellula sp. SWK7]